MARVDVLDRSRPYGTVAPPMVVGDSTVHFEQGGRHYGPDFRRVYLPGEKPSPAPDAAAQLATSMIAPHGRAQPAGLAPPPPPTAAQIAAEQPGGAKVTVVEDDDPDDVDTDGEGVSMADLLGADDHKDDDGSIAPMGADADAPAVRSAERVRRISKMEGEGENPAPETAAERRAAKAKAAQAGVDGEGAKPEVNLTAWATKMERYQFAQVKKEVRKRYSVSVTNEGDALDLLVKEGVVTEQELKRAGWKGF